MKSELLDYIQFLSQEDQKNLVEKAGKTCSEAGDLMEDALSYSSAAGTTHRFVDRFGVFDETIDTILCAISCAYSLGYSHEEIESHMLKKSQKWRGLQLKEQKIKDPKNIAFEIHLTVKHTDIQHYGIEHFKQACEKLGVKPIMLDLQSQDGSSIMNDVQTSSIVYGDNRMAYEKLEFLRSELWDFGYNVVRSKIETDPRHPAAPWRDGGSQIMPKDCYFEAHIGVVVEATALLPSESLLPTLAKNHKAHLSRNTFKKLDEGRRIVMLTLRTYEGFYEDFQKQVEALQADLTRYGYEYEKTIIEFSLYDTNVSHDSAWLLGKETVLV